MPDNEKLITLDNLGTFKDNIEEEIREGSLNTPEVIILSSTSGTLDSETLNKLKEHPAHYVLNVGGGNIYYFTVENGSGLQYDTKVITGSLLETKYLFINKATGDLSTGTTGPELVEVVEYQTTTPLTSKQVAKAQAGKLAVLDDNRLFVLFSKDSNTVTFAAYTVSYQDGHYSQACYTLRQQRRVLTISSRMFTQASFTEYHLVADIVEDFIGNTDTPNASGKQIVRALNLRKTQDMITPNVYSASATYAVGDVVIYQNQLYRCTTAIGTAEAWDSTHWELTNVVEMAKEKGAYIVEVPTTGVQTEELGAEIEKADAIIRGVYTAWRREVNSSDVIFFSTVPSVDGIRIAGNTWIYKPSTRELSSYSSGNMALLTRQQIISEFLTFTSYSPGDFVCYNNNVYRCTTAHTGAWSSSDFTLVVLADEIHSDIVTITATGVQSDEMAAKIENAKALMYDNKVYVLYSDDASTKRFVGMWATVNSTARFEISYAKSTKEITALGATNYNRVASIGGKSGYVTLGNGLSIDNSNVLSSDLVDLGYSAYDATATYSLGDIVVYDHKLYQCISAVSTAEAWDSTHWQQVAVDVNDIVTLTSTGVQSDEMAAKILNAKALYYDHKLFSKAVENSAEIQFYHQVQETSRDIQYYLVYGKTNKSIAYSTYSRNRVASIGGQHGQITVDNSLEVTSDKVAKLTGKLPYLTTAPTADNTSGFLTIVVLPSEPDTRYSGYMYVITGSNS